MRGRGFVISASSLREKGCRPSTRSRGHPSNSPSSVTKRRVVWRVSRSRRRRALRHDGVWGWPHSRSERRACDGRQSGVRRAEGGGGRRQHRHGAGGHGRHAGAADRQALPGRVFRRRRARGDARLRLPAGQRHRHGAGAGLRGGELGQGLRRFRAEAGPRHAAQGALARRHGAGAVRRAGPPPPRRAAFAARHAQAPGGAARGPEDARLLRLRARVLPVRRDLQVGGGQALSRAWRRPAATSRTITSSRPARRRA